MLEKINFFLGYRITVFLFFSFALPATELVRKMMMLTMSRSIGVMMRNMKKMTNIMKMNTWMMNMKKMIMKMKNMKMKNMKRRKNQEKRKLVPQVLSSIQPQIEV